MHRRFRGWPRPVRGRQPAVPAVGGYGGGRIGWGEDVGRVRSRSRRGRHRRSTLGRPYPPSHYRPGMPYEALLFDVTDGVATITINRPERRNALSWTVMSELRAAFEAAKADPS